MNDYFAWYCLAPVVFFVIGYIFGYIHGHKP